MSAADDERNVRPDFGLAKKWREQMPLEMVDGEIGFAKPIASPFAIEAPIINELAKPGPLVAANASISEMSILASRATRSSKRGACTR